MPKQFRGLTDHPFDRKTSNVRNKFAESMQNKSGDDNPPFLEFDNNKIVSINYYDNESKKYISVSTSLSKKDVKNLTDEEINKIAIELLTKRFNKIKSDYEFKDLEIPQKQTYFIKGSSSVKKIDVGIYASTNEDEVALHYLLEKIREKL